MKAKTGLLVVLVTMLANLVPDRITKILAVHFLKGNEPLSFLRNTFVLWYTENDGAFLSMGSTWPVLVKIIVLLIIPIAVCLVCFAYSAFFEKNRVRGVLITTIAVGGISNLYDRLVNDFRVIDFMNFGIGNLRTGILNVADLSVTFGVIILVIYEIRAERRAKAKT
jgi:signal peptidase II